MSILNPGGINDVSGLAGVIQGEAGSDPNEQFAVASTISNRLSGLFGNFGGSLSSVVSPTAFNGFSNTPNANATALASAIVNGNNLSSFGNPGNVTFFSASNFSTNPSAANFVNPSMQAVAGAGNIVSPGGNSFSAGTTAGPNLGATVLPQLGGSGASGMASGGDFVSVNPSDSNFDDITGIPVAGVNAPAAAVTTPASTATGVAGAGGTPVNITDLSGLDSSVSGAGKAVQSGAGTIGGDVTSAAGGITGTIASAISSLEQYTSSTFVVVALVVMGIIFVAFGLGLFGKNKVEQLV
jgi:hypothetical protein